MYKSAIRDRNFKAETTRQIEERKPYTRRPMVGTAGDCESLYQATKYCMNTCAVLSHYRDPQRYYLFVIFAYFFFFFVLSLFCSYILSFMHIAFAASFQVEISFPFRTCFAFADSNSVKRKWFHRRGIFLASKTGRTS